MALPCRIVTVVLCLHRQHPFALRRVQVLEYDLLVLEYARVLCLCSAERWEMSPSTTRMCGMQLVMRSRPPF